MLVYTIHGSVPRTTTVDIFCVQQCSTNNRLCILVRAQLRTQSTWPLSLTRLAIWLQDLDLPSEYTLGHCCLSAASRHKLAITSRHYSLYSQLLNSFFVKEKCWSSMFWPPHQGFQGHFLTNLIINASLNANTYRKLEKMIPKRTLKTPKANRLRWLGGLSAWIPCLLTLKMQGWVPS